MQSSAGYPISFWLCCLSIVGGLLYGWVNRRSAWGLPAMAVLTTVAVWYVGDAIYNDYDEYVVTIGAETLDSAWWQVLLFVMVFSALVTQMNNWINGSIKQRGSMMIRYFETRRLEHPDVQRKITHAANGLFCAWGALMTVALIRVDGDAFGLFFPYLAGYKAEPWGRNRVGGGLDAVISLASYVQVFLTAGAGVVAALARRPGTRSIAITICVLTFPFYVFDRTRNAMLATVLPGLLAWIFLRIRGGIIVKSVVLLIAFLGVNWWFSFVMANRGDMSIAAATRSSERKSEETGSHGGLNMFEELAWINYLLEKGTYNPNFGSRYFAELVNPIPRALWKGKPMIGVDYAKARGQGGDNEAAAGMNASVSTGMIGQGVVNFGGFFGPIAAAALVAAWSALLARQDLLGGDPSRLLMYACGMTLTFNMGRDITLLVLYPFLFGLGMLKILYYFRPQGKDSAPPPRRRPRRVRKRPGSKGFREEWAKENHD